MDGLVFDCLLLAVTYKRILDLFGCNPKAFLGFIFHPFIMQKNISSIIASLLLLPLLLVAQQIPIPNNSVQTIRQFGLYINVATAELEQVQQALEEINKQTNAWAEGKLPSINIPASINSKGLGADALYGQCTNMSMGIEAHLRGEAVQQLGKFKSVSDELKHLRDDLLTHIRTGAYISTRADSAKYIFKKLKRAEVLYYDAKVLQDKSRWGVEKIIQAYSPQQLPSSIVLMYNDLKAMEEVCQDIFQCLCSEGRSVDLPNQRKRLEGLIAKAGQPSQRLQTANPDLVLHADAVIRQAKQILKQVQDYASPTFKQTSHLEFSKDYYFHNEKVLPPFNFAKTGFVDEFNAFVQKADIHVALLNYEPPIYQRKIPDFLKEKEEKMPSIDEILKLAEEKRKAKETAEAAKKTVTPPSNAAPTKVTTTTATATTPTPKPTPTPAAKPEPAKPKPTLDGFATNNLVFLLDASASMGQEGRLPLLKESMKYLLQLMRPEDRISIVTFSSSSAVILPPTSGLYKDTILSALAKVQPGGISKADVGLKRAYDVAKGAFITGGNNRIIVATDGFFELDRATKKLIKNGAGDGTKLSVFYFGKKELEDAKKMLTNMAEDGGGRYCFVKPENAMQTVLDEAQQVRR